ncbi:peptidoglycan-recognition protein 3-like isoform X2 [Macrosteles quadrilineatus]|uniref:peptidoglycan-recognition protein 3-like isoform X2 n=1 Tax=Macrosteles quadrilineatus TaxID=74068 RepID=UPI0023E3349D|nr:peptidoglycan-recognition protein 3-like isoform X2 [Macrosteles quadrilineatus]
MTTDTSEEFAIIPRFEWSGTKIELYETKDLPIRPATIVYAASTHTGPCFDPLFCEGTLRFLQHKHFSRFPTDIRFNFMIGGDGRVYEGRGWMTPPRLAAFAVADAMRSILIGFVGMYKEDQLPDEMCSAANKLIEYGKRNNYIEQNCLYKSITDFTDKVGTPNPAEAKFVF